MASLFYPLGAAEAQAGLDSAWVRYDARLPQYVRVVAASILPTVGALS